MADGIVIDKHVFSSRLSNFIQAWKNDKRASNGVFNDASSIIILMGKANDDGAYLKNNAFHVSSGNRHDFTSRQSLTLLFY